MANAVDIPAPAPSRPPPLSPRCPRYHSLDFWRGFACLLIVVYHSTFYAATPDLLSRVMAAGGTSSEWLMAACSWLWVGVPLFFVISGYCISATADSARRRDVPVRVYLWRRFRRIFPPYWIFLAVSVVTVWATESLVRPGLFVDHRHAFPHPASLSPLQWLGTISLTEIWRHHLFGPEMRLFLQHAWTLCYEEQFYAVVGLILLVSPRRFFPLAAAVTAAVFALEILPARLVPAVGVIRRHSTGFFFDGYWLYFAAGIGVYYSINYATRTARTLLVATLLVGVAWGLRSGTESRTVSFAFALLLLALHRWDAPLSAAAWSVPVSWCGAMCYSLYLVHLPVCKALSHALVLAGIESPTETALITVPACLVASLLTAWTFHLLVERRFLNSAHAPRHPVATVASGSAAETAAAGAALA